MGCKGGMRWFDVSLRYGRVGVAAFLAGLAGCSLVSGTSPVTVELPPREGAGRGWSWRVVSTAGVREGRFSGTPGEKRLVELPREAVCVVLVQPLPAGGGRPFWMSRGAVVGMGEGRNEAVVPDRAGGAAGEMLLRLFRQDPGGFALFNGKRFAQTVREELGEAAWQMDREKVFALWETGTMRESAVVRKELRDGWWVLPRPGVWYDRSGRGVEAGPDGGVWVESFPVGCREFLHGESGERVWVKVPAEGEILAGPSR